jgi:S1-C subfamily serine protease
MISSPTGSYAGYSFAVPSNLARKIVEDLMEFGNVQRGVLGIEGRELNTAAAKEIDTEETSGVYVAKVSKGTGAEKAGLKSGDIIKKLDEKNINSFADLTAYINTKRPNDDVKVGFIRDGKLLSVPVKLVKKELVSYDLRGLELEDLDAGDKKRFRLSYGVKIKDVSNEDLAEYADQLKGGIILKVDNIKATDIETVTRVLSKKSDNQKTRIEMLTNSGDLLSFLL